MEVNKLDHPDIPGQPPNPKPAPFARKYPYPQFMVLQGELSDEESSQADQLPSGSSVKMSDIDNAVAEYREKGTLEANSGVDKPPSPKADLDVDMTDAPNSTTASDMPASSDNDTAIDMPASSELTTLAKLHPSWVISLVKGKIHVKFPPLPPNVCEKPINLLNLPQAVRNKIYHAVLGPHTSVQVFKFNNLPADTRVHPRADALEYSQPAIALLDTIASLGKLFLICREVHREAASVFYGQQHFILEQPWGIGFMTGTFGLTNCSYIRYFKVRMDYLKDIQLTIKDVFPNLKVLQIHPSEDWYKAWYQYLVFRHGSYIDNAVKDVVKTSWNTETVGLKEVARLARKRRVVILLKYWVNPISRHPAVTDMPLIIENGCWELRR